MVKSTGHLVSLSLPMRLKYRVIICDYLYWLEIKSFSYSTVAIRACFFLGHRLSEEGDDSHEYII